MNVIICEPNVPPCVQSIKGNYENLKEIIGDRMKALSTSDPNIVIICNSEMYNEEERSQVNRLNIPGTFLFVGYENDRLRSLFTEEIHEIIDTIRKEDLSLVH